MLVPLENFAAVIATSWRSFADSLTLALIQKASVAASSSSTMTASKKLIDWTGPVAEHDYSGKSRADMAT